MPLLPADPWSLLGFGLIAATIAILLFSDWPKAYLLGASSIVLFGLQFLQQGIQGGFLGLHELALVPTQLLAGDWWSPVTYAFLHGGLFHLFGNLFILLTAGPALEDSVGSTWFLTIYAAGALAAGAAGVALSQTTALVHAGTAMVGSSGAIFAVLTAFAVRHPREKLPLLFFIVLWLPSMVVLLVFLAMNIGYIFLDTNVAWYGHFAGFLAGLAIASFPLATGTPSTRQAPFDPDAWRPLAQTDRAHDALDHLDTLDPHEADVRQAWLDVLADELTCPTCHSRLEHQGDTLTCPNGHDPTTPTNEA